MKPASPSHEPGTQEPHLKRTLGLPSVLLFGLAYMAPLIVYGTYGVLAGASQDTAALAYLIALIAIVFTALSYGKLARLFPVAGSAYTYTRKSFNSHLGFMIGWATLLDYFFLPMVIWLIGAAYLGAAFPSVPTWIWIVAFIVFTSALNIVGIELAARFNIVLMIVQLGITAMFVVLCLHYAAAAAGPGGLIAAQPFFQPHVPLSATMAGAAIAAYSYLGFDAVSTLTEETIEPEKTIPRAIVLIALVGGAIFVIAAYTLQLAHPGAVFKDPDSAAFEIARKVGGDIFVTIFLAGLILAQFASGISAQASVGRLLYAMGRDEVLPRSIFGYIHPRFRTPAINIAIAGIVGLIALKLDVATSTSFINFGAFLAFTSVNLCVIRQYFSGAAGTRGFGFLGGLVFPLIGAVTDIWLLCSLERTAIVLGIIWFVLGVVYLGWITRCFRQAPPEMAV
ncbi:APC family permease [Paraburkholderia silvatlantica]|uniref:Amino acid transporter n=1 Tax=Paraburkholderia silvatlantica TaxID=321895 RepID=A0ABR6FMT6_9BURK|nr:APC family permease [Paraburkholderia silvatlantica]MBB2928746.1 amino acid transporter [Paraburkholderia silvatlantica]PVY35329.1 amino acid/polyamine/organocation transporter (APC superfamily) [Paraburkholderia silvatlantica]PXW40971.1 amino acid/polyamine/organocation transporter (APC superfamily) [Paraburkholderia silvatlantica]TDQ98202.1 amino acid/polyamine/organocation transporter (APC superfamily) [Paraburkholderia silvatlantica]